MRRKSFDHLQKLSFRFYDNQKTGHLVARVTKDLEEIGEVAHHGPEDLFIAIMTFIGRLRADVHRQPDSWRSSPRWSCRSSPGFRSTYGARMTRNWRTLFGRVGEFNARIEENVGGMRVVQAFANEDHERGLFAARQRELSRDQARRLPADGGEHVAELPQHARRRSWS